MKVSRVRLNIVVISAAVLAGLAILIYIFRDRPPVKEFDLARKSISQARYCRSDIYAAELFNQSENIYDSALASWKRENKKFFIARDFSKVKDYISLSAELAVRAKEQSLENTKELKSGLKISIDLLAGEVNKFQLLFDKLPVPESVRSDNSRGRLLLEEAKIAYQGKNYSLCNEKMAVASGLLALSYNYARKLLKDYFSDYPDWEEKAQQNVKHSIKANSYTILVDKYSRQCFVYSGGKIRYTFGFELGKNWIGDKRYMGDKATPEGHYKIISKKEGAQTKYYKALLLDYPNETDRQRFSQDKRNGGILKSAEIGGLIEIHGNGGKGTDWTDGCIALMNQDMDILYKLVQKGTMVTIVGSLKPLEEILKK